MSDQNQVVEIVLNGGLVESVKAPKGITVKIYDYDTEGTSLPIQTDPDGDPFIESVYDGNDDWQ